MNRSGKIHALLSTARIANVPSVVSNVWLGVAMSAFWGGWGSFPNPWSATVLLAAAGVLLYVSGNFLNDWMDREWDSQNRPERALPRGLFPPGLYLGIASGCALGGIALAAMTNRASAAVAFLILGMIVTYTRWHKRSPWAVIPMGLCRALLPVMGAVGFSAVFFAPGDWISLQLPTGQMFQIKRDSFAVIPHLGIVGACAFGLLCHIAGLSLSARYESMANPPASISHLARILFATTAIVISYATYTSNTATIGFGILGLLPYCIWIFLSLSVWRKPVPKHVSKLLAGIPLVDWMALLPITLASLAPMGTGWTEPFAATCLFLPPLAFILALLLQRLAPAT